jgi:hypothetical protein
VAPRLFVVIAVQEALTNPTYLRHTGALTVGVITDFFLLWDLLSDFELQLEIEDRHVWRLASNGQYSAKSAYEDLFLGSTLFGPWEKIWHRPNVVSFCG